MGLDMYLTRSKKVKGLSFNDICNLRNYISWKKREDNYSFFECFGIEETDVKKERIDDVKDVYFEDVGYWRKANQIHNWFVHNVQGGEDNCKFYEVSQSKLIELRDTCQKILDIAVIDDGYVLDSEWFGNDIEKIKKRAKENVRDAKVVQKGENIEVYVPGKVIRNADMIAELLPTSVGFFFGNYEYNQYYLEDIKETIDIINNVLDDTDFEEYTIAYRSSW